MSRPIVLDRTTGIGIAASILAAGLVVGAGAFFGGYLVGESAPQAPPTELAERTYAVADLEEALAACEIKGAAVEAASVTLVGAEHSPMKRQCFVAEMGPPELVSYEYSYSGWGTPESDWLDGGKYSWSNVYMVWEQTENGRDVTITVE